MSETDNKINTIKFNDIYNLHIKYIDYLLAKTLFSHKQGVNSVTLCGTEVESEIRLFFKNMLPPRFRVTHGYILFAEDNIKDPIVSPQVDLIIVDDLVLNKMFTLDKENGMEIVPVEAVIGVFEIKRTLDKESVNKAFTHLEKIIKSHDHTIEDNTIENPKKFRELELDAIFSFSGISYLSYVIKYDEKNKKEIYIQTTTRNSKESRTEFYTEKSEITQSGIISQFLGYLVGYLTNCTGRRPDLRNYFFHESTWNKENVKSDS
jgi:hypothetical protein